MRAEHPVSSLAIDLTQMHRRTVSSFYSNLVTRHTGRAVRTGVESQLLEMGENPGIRLSVLDFSQVRVLDYSCADEIVAKLLLRYGALDRPAEAYFIARGLQEHHREAIEAVLERHDLRLIVHEPDTTPEILGPADPVERRCWTALARLGRGSPEEVAPGAGLSPEAASAALRRMVVHRVAVPLREGAFCAISALPATR